MDIKQKRKRFNALLAKANLMNVKQDILSGYNVSSTLELSEVQLDDLIIKVQGLVDKSRTEADYSTRTWRHKCLRVMSECGVNTVNWNEVNEFMLNKRICGRHLYDLNIEELKTLHRKLNNIKDKKEVKQQERERLAKLN